MKNTVFKTEDLQLVINVSFVSKFLHFSQVLNV